MIGIVPEIVLPVGVSLQVNELIVAHPLEEWQTLHEPRLRRIGAQLLAVGLWHD